MKILILTQHWFPDALGGAYRVARDQAVGLASAGHDVTVCALGVADEPAGKTKIQGVTLYRYGKHTARYFGMTMAVLWTLPRLVRSLGRTRTFDRVIAHDPYSAVAVRKVGMRAPMLYVFHAVHAQELAVEGLTRWQHGWKKLVAPMLLKWFIKKTVQWEQAALTHARAIVVFSQYAEQSLSKAYPRLETPGYIVPIGIDTEMFTPAYNREEVRQAHGMITGQCYFVTARRLTPRMGVKELIAAMQIVHVQMPHARLLIAGDGPLKTALTHEVLRRELDGIVQFVGTLSGNDLVTFYQAADCFVLPTQSFETFGLATAEALATGLPVVGTPVGATRELLEPIDPDLLAENATASALAKAMLRVADLPIADRVRIGERGRRLIVDCFGKREAIKALMKVLSVL